MLGAGLIAAIDNWFLRLILLVCVAVYTYCSVKSARQLAASGDRILVDENGIQGISADGRATTLTWNEVATVSTGDSAGELALSDSPGSGRILVRYEIGYFGELLDFVIAHALARQSLSSPQPLFIRSYAGLGASVGMSALVMALGVADIHDGNWSGAIFLPIATVPFWPLLVVPLKLVVAADSFTLVYLGRKRRVPFGSVSDVYVYCTKVGRRRALAVIVLVDLIDGSRLEVGGYRDGSVAVYDALHAAWMRAGGSSHPSESATG